MNHKSRLLLYAVMALVIQSGIASATTISVNDNGEEDYTSIQEAIDVANSGDTILVQNGTYYEHLLLIREDNLTLLGENKETTIIDGSGIGGIIKLISVNNCTIQGFTVQNGTKPSITEGFPTIMGYTQEFLKENYSLTILEVSMGGKEAWISLSKNGGEVDKEIVRIGEIYNYEVNYEPLLSFKLDEIFIGNSINFIEICNVNQFSEIDNSMKIVDNESALLVPRSSGRFISTGGGISRELEENYSLNVIDIQTYRDHQRKVMLFLIKNNSVIDYDIINVGENYTYYKDGNLTLKTDIDAVFTGEGGIDLVKLSHVYQYSENNPNDILLNDAVYLYFVGNARETEWILEQNYSLSAVDIDVEDKYTMVPLPLILGSQQFIEATVDINTNNYIPQLWLRLMKDGATVENQFVCPGDNITFYNNGSKILDLTVGIIFDGRDADLATISNVSQYNETDENDRLIQNESHMYIFEYPKRDARELDENYSITFMDIDSSTHSNPLVWVRMEKNGILVDDQIIAQSEVYQFYNNSIKIFNASIDTIFSGRYLDLLILNNISQYSEEDGTQLLVNANWSIYSDNVELIENLNKNLVLYENYTIIPVDIDIDGMKVWIRLYKNNTIVNEIILEEGDYYSYYLDSEKIISTTLETVFFGMYTELIKLVDIYQYSEENGTLILYKDSALLKLHHFSFDNDEGIHIDTSSSNIIRNNNIQDVGQGISLAFSINNRLINNNITDNNYGIHLEDYSNYNSITDNNIINNSEGIRLQNSNYNHIYFNNFINNSFNAYSSISTNIWNSSDPIYYQYSDSTFINYIGNYWSDYTGSDVDYDGIGDTPYNISEVVWDTYPLTEQWDEEYLIIPHITITSPANQATDIEINMNVTATFSVPMDSSTLNNNTVKVYSLDKKKGETFENTSGSWNSTNFLDFIYTEQLKILPQLINDSHRTIGEGNVTYSTQPLLKNYSIYTNEGKKVGEAGNYSVIGWLGDENVVIQGGTGDWIISKLVFEQNSTDTKTLHTGETWDLGDGYSFKLLELDVDGNEAWVALNDSSGEIDTQVCVNQTACIFSADLGGPDGSPIFVTYLNKVNLTQFHIELKYTWLISQDTTEIQNNEHLGDFRVKTYTDRIIIENDEDMFLMRGSTIPLFDNLMFEVEDTSTVRYRLVHQAAPPLKGDVSYNSSSRTVTFDPVSNLNENTDYFPLITTGAEDLAGNGLTEDYVWTFRTIDATPPEINSVTLDTNTPIAGDEILVTVNTIDNNAVTNVTANGIALYPQDGNIWNGTITALGGTHFVNVSSRDAAGNIDWNNSTSYTTISANVIFIITNNTDSPIEGATVSLHKIKNETDADGTAIFTNVAFGDYKYKVRMKGYKQTAGIINVNDYTVKEIELPPKK